MSDFGTVDHYVAAVKAVMLSESPNQTIVDITHDIRPFDIAHASTVLKHIYRDFPDKTVHLVAVDSMKGKSSLIAVELDGHFFVGFDAGLFSLISSQKPDHIVVIDGGDTAFPAKEVLAKAALQLAGGSAIQKLGETTSEMTELYARQLKTTKREIAGHVISVDHYGNLITNIAKKEFETIRKINGDEVAYAVRFGRESFQKIHTYFTEVDAGDCYILFNSSGWLQIGINQGNASQLLGLSIDSPVTIEFKI